MLCMLKNVNILSMSGVCVVDCDCFYFPTCWLCGECNLQTCTYMYKNNRLFTAEEFVCVLYTCDCSGSGKKAYTFLLLTDIFCYTIFFLVKVTN